jgi:hypothetical protein
MKSTQRSRDRSNARPGRVEPGRAAAARPRRHSEVREVSPRDRQLRLLGRLYAMTSAEPAVDASALFERAGIDAEAGAAALHSLCAKGLVVRDGGDDDRVAITLLGVLAVEWNDEGAVVGAPTPEGFVGRRETSLGHVVEA